MACFVSIAALGIVNKILMGIFIELFASFLLFQNGLERSFNF